MAKEFAKAFYKSRAWQECRQAFIIASGGLCNRCAARGLIVPGYIVHHKIILTPDNINDPNVALNFDNLEYLCHACHDAEHLNKKEPGIRWKFVDGELCEKVQSPIKFYNGNVQGPEGGT